MDNIIELNNINYQLEGNCLFENLNLQIEKGAFLSLIGKSGSGKTILLKILTGLIQTNNKIKIDGLYLKEENLLSIRSKIGIVFENPEVNIIADKVKDDILYSIPQNKYSSSNLEKKISEIVQLLQIEELLEKNTSQLSGGEKQLVAIAGALMKGAKILILDNCFSMLDGVSKEKILKRLKKINREKKLTIIYVTSDIEDILYGTHVALLGDKKIKFYGKNNEAFNQEGIFLEEGIEMPFMIQLSNKLKYYGLIDRNILDVGKMVNEIWK